MEEVCGDTGWGTAWAVTTAPPVTAPKAEPWALPQPVTSKEPPVRNRILEHLPERRRVMRVGRGFEIKAENGRVVVTPESVYWKVTGIKGRMDRGVQKRSKGNDKRNSHSNGGTDWRKEHTPETDNGKKRCVGP
eukprot:CAMPEP_0198680676 /NCGR_PEP_ID=MMETSP1468-20131203/5320_1 /TAXON_ID=1461545 /ORGANISM="Mantoniella sp, Strain CCMP1436" /LENGTH=133 /DNA_ID=CAMNT_0044421311 /DNA_START=5 /DNA_END=403 /DNA_ORIENTATION=+